jgi:hypothetical protein
MNKRQKILAVIVNHGVEQIRYLETVVRELKSFSKYDVTIIVNSNVELIINEIDKVNIIALEDYQLLPLTCRKIIWTNKDNYDVFLYGENDHLFTETHIDNHLLYAEILPKNRISGLLQYEENETGIYYPGYHFDYEWDFDSVEVYKDKKFAHFSNLHQATFILTKKQLLRIGKKIDFTNLVKDDPSTFIVKVKNKLTKHFDYIFERPNKYSVKCKVNTDIYKYGGMKKMICISDFEDNLIHHLPNIYIDGLKGRNKFRSDQIRMKNSLIKLLEKTRK